MIRQPAVAGQFYPGTESRLRDDLSRLIHVVEPRRKVRGVISPHAGYMYSGAVAGYLFGRIEIPSTVVILGPNHHGIGAAAALYPEGKWMTPLGLVTLDSTLAALVRKHVPFVEEDSAAHRFEHSLEVQVPFLQYLQPTITIVPLCLGFGDFATSRALGHGLARAITEFGQEVLIVASSDMTHYESAQQARAKDDVALREILALNGEGLVSVCRRNGITMCGVIPSAVMLETTRELGATEAKLEKYATSGDITGDNRQVVAYAAVTVE